MSRLSVSGANKMVRISRRRRVELFPPTQAFRLTARSNESGPSTIQRPNRPSFCHSTKRRASSAPRNLPFLQFQMRKGQAAFGHEYPRPRNKQCVLKTPFAARSVAAPSPIRCRKLSERRNLGIATWDINPAPRSPFSASTSFNSARCRSLSSKNLLPSEPKATAFFRRFLFAVRFHHPSVRNRSAARPAACKIWDRLPTVR